MKNNEFENVESFSKILERIASQFEVDSEEYGAIKAAAGALVSVAVSNVNNELEMFCMRTGSDQVSDSEMGDWIINHPDASVGMTAVINGILFVVSEDRNGKSQLHRVTTSEVVR